MRNKKVSASQSRSLERLLSGETNWSQPADPIAFFYDIKSRAAAYLA
ncbi:hypothetical protein NBRC13296_24130 [Paenibacillus chitinolyticus]